MQPVRVVVCGTRFGQVYLDACGRGGDDGVELVGVFATGSPRSQECARLYDVPLYTRIEDVPQDVDVVCVVVRGGLLGGPGTELAGQFLKHGFDVIQEHPVHAREIAANVKIARRTGSGFMVNSFYVHVPPVKAFLAACGALRETRAPIWLDAACGFQLAFSMLDMLGRSVGALRPWSFAPPATLPPTAAEAVGAERSFMSVDGCVGGVSMTLRVQNELDPADPDNFAHLMHRLTLGVDAGHLSLVETHGPTLWSARPDFPRDVTDRQSSHFERHARDSIGTSTLVIGDPDVPDYTEIYRTSWAVGVRNAIRGVVDLRHDRAAFVRNAQWQLGVAEMWQDLTAVIGPPALLSGGRPTPLSAAEREHIQTAYDTVRHPPRTSGSHATRSSGGSAP